MRSFALAAGMLTVMSLAAACREGGRNDIGGTWVLDHFANESGDVSALVPEPPTLILDGGDASGNSGCNLFSGQYRLESNALSFEALQTTERACLDAERNDQERRYYAALAATARVHLDGDTLELRDADGAPLLVFERAS